MVRSKRKTVFELLILTGPNFSGTLELYEDLSPDQIQDEDLGSPSIVEAISLDTTDADSFVKHLNPFK